MTRIYGVGNCPDCGQQWAVVPDLIQRHMRYCKKYQERIHNENSN